jgi:hypothetical protein
MKLVSFEGDKKTFYHVADDKQEDENPFVAAVIRNGRGKWALITINGNSLTSDELEEIAALMNGLA